MFAVCGTKRAFSSAGGSAFMSELYGNKEIQLIMLLRGVKCCSLIYIVYMLKNYIL